MDEAFFFGLKYIFFKDLKTEIRFPCLFDFFFDELLTVLLNFCLKFNFGNSHVFFVLFQTFLLLKSPKFSNAVENVCFHFFCENKKKNSPLNKNNSQFARKYALSLYRI